MQRRSGTRYKEVLREEEAIYIPLLNSLEQLLNKASILQEVSLLTLNFVWRVYSEVLELRPGTAF